MNRALKVAAFEQRRDVARKMIQKRLAETPEWYIAQHLQKVADEIRALIESNGAILQALSQVNPELVKSGLIERLRDISIVCAPILNEATTKPRSHDRPGLSVMDVLEYAEGQLKGLLQQLENYDPKIAAERPASASAPAKTYSSVTEAMRAEIMGDRPESIAAAAGAASEVGSSFRWVSKK